MKNSLFDKSGNKVFFNPSHLYDVVNEKLNMMEEDLGNKNQLYKSYLQVNNEQVSLKKLKKHAI